MFKGSLTTDSYNIDSSREHCDSSGQNSVVLAVSLGVQGKKVTFWDGHAVDGWEWMFPAMTVVATDHIVC